MVGVTFSAVHAGVEGMIVRVESAPAAKLPQIQIIGLPGDVVKESRDRIRACLLNLGFHVPTQKVVVHLSPAHWKKEGQHLDVAIAVSLLVSENILSPENTSRLAFLGGLGLDAKIQEVRGSLALVEVLTREPSVDFVLLPEKNASEAALLESKKIRLMKHFGDVLTFCRERDEKGFLPPPTKKIQMAPTKYSGMNLDDVHGQKLGKRALEVALSGGHHLLFMGPPGVGKSMLAQCAPALLPPLSRTELIEVLKNRPGAQEESALSWVRPFRSPHHSISSAGLLGGGSGKIVAGEVSLAHRGVLFLDELPEFRRDAIEGLREPLENGNIHLHRIGHNINLPAQFSLIAAMNPCPCGKGLSDKLNCVCGWERVLAYRRRVSGPVIDRIDIFAVLSHPNRADEGSVFEKVKTNIHKTWSIQRQRYQGDTKNARARVSKLEGPFQLGKEEHAWLEDLQRSGEMSYRAIHKIIRVGRTIADIAGSPRIRTDHLLEAWSFRCPNFASDLSFAS